MTRGLVLVALAASVSCGGSSRSGGARPQTVLSPAQIAEKALPSVVLIRTPQQLGTGFVVWQDGRIATNLHVIAGAREASVMLQDGREFKDIQVLAADERRDLAIIRISAKGLAPLPLSTATVKAGERVVAIGHPLGLGNTVSDGLISAVRELDQITLLQISAPIAPGSSGGPIFNDRGEVIGVATLYTTEGQNLNFGVPVAYLKPLLLREKPTSLAQFATQLDQSLLEGCTADEVKLAVETIFDAIKVGAPIYNKGDHEGCYRIYEKEALGLVGKMKACVRLRETLLGGLSAANKADGYTAKAWALRHTFDRIVGAVDRALKR